jgi:hypothetical protein
MSDETYIGDGVYASFDGYQIKLRAPLPEGDQIIFLERVPWNCLVEFVEGLKEDGSSK